MLKLSCCSFLFIYDHIIFRFHLTIGFLGYFLAILSYTGIYLAVSYVGHTFSQQCHRLWTHGYGLWHRYKPVMIRCCDNRFITPKIKFIITLLLEMCWFCDKMVWNKYVQRKSRPIQSERIFWDCWRHQVIILSSFYNSKDHLNIY